MKKRILSIVFCLAVAFTAMAYMGIDNPVVPTADAADKSGKINATTISSNQTWDLIGDVTLNGKITINSGKTLTINGNGYDIIKTRANTS